VESDYEELELTLPKPPSLNVFYSGRHFMVRKKYKEEYWKHIETALQSFDRFYMEQFALDVSFNCRFDVDNAICCSKFLADYLRKFDYVKDDNPKHFISQSTTFNENLEKNTFRVKIKVYGFKTIE